MVANEFLKGVCDVGSYTKYSLTAFIALIGPIVQRVHAEGGRLLPSVRMAQSWLETGGNVPSWYNLGGYKVGSGQKTAFWYGDSVNTATKEVYNGVTVNTTANWRAYESIYHFYKDQDLLFDHSRYERVRASSTIDEQCNALYQCGYATDPLYPNKLKSIIKSNGLEIYDMEDEDKMKLEEYQWKMLESNIANAVEAKIINDKAWLVKVQKRTITNSELNWLNNIIILRLVK